MTSARKFAIMEDKINKVYAMLEGSHMEQMGLLTSKQKASQSSKQPSPIWFEQDSSNTRFGANVQRQHTEQNFISVGSRIITAIWPEAPFTSVQKFRSLTDDQIAMLIKSAKPFTYGLLTVLDEKILRSDNLSSDQALLTAAAVVAAAHVHALDQKGLACEFEFLLSYTLFSKGQRNNIILQSLLVFSMQHHFYMHRDGPSVMMIQHLCLSLLADLEYHKHLLHRDVGSSRTHAEETGQNKGEQEAYLLCYYLSCGLMFKCGSGRLELPSAERIPQFVEDLLNNEKADIDQSLLFITKLCVIIDEIQKTFRNTIFDAAHDAFDEVFTSLHVKRFELLIETLQNSIRKSGVHNGERYSSDELDTASSDTRFCIVVSLSLAWKFAYVLLYARALQPRAVLRDSSSSNMRFTLQTYCLRSVKLLLDGVLGLNEDELSHLTFVDWIWILSTFTAVGRLPHPSLASPGVSLRALNIPQTLDYYTKEFSKRLVDSPSYSQSKHGSWDFPTWLKQICIKIRQSSVYVGPEQECAPIAGSSLITATQQGKKASRLNASSGPNGTAHPTGTRVSTTALDPGTSFLELDKFDRPANDFPWESLMSSVQFAEL